MLKYVKEMSMALLGWLGLLHFWLFDTVILATSRRTMEKKLKLLLESTKALKFMNTNSPRELL